MKVEIRSLSIMRLEFQAVLYSVDRPLYHGMELPPGGLAEADIPADIHTKKETLYGVMIGSYGTECRFPSGYENVKNHPPEIGGMLWLAPAYAGGF